MGDRFREIAGAVGTLLLFLTMLFFGLAFWGVVVMAGLGLFGVLDLDTDAERTKPAKTPVERGAAGFCDPNYTGCVPDSPYDVDCEGVAGPVRVIGTDVNRLDRDSDGIACE